MTLDLDHAITFLAGSTALAIVAHAVNTFPVPGNQYGRWLLGVIQFAIGQRQRATNTIADKDTITTAQDKQIA